MQDDKIDNGKTAGLGSVSVAEPAVPNSVKAPIPTARALRHDPEVIRHGFESGEYPYRTKLRNTHYLEQMSNGLRSV